MSLFWIPENVPTPVMQLDNYFCPTLISRHLQQCHPHATNDWTQEALTTQLEKLLSREAILSNTDPFLTSLVVKLGTLELPAALLMCHPLLSPVTMDQLLQAASNSRTLIVDHERQMIIPGLKPKRSTLILRDVDPSVTSQDIVSLLETCHHLSFLRLENKGSTEPDGSMNPNADNPVMKDTEAIKACPEIQSLIFGGNNCWFLTLDTEESTRKVALWLKDKKLKGEAVHVRMKTESPLRVSLVIPHVFAQPSVPLNEKQMKRAPRIFKKTNDRNKSTYPKSDGHYKTKSKKNSTQQLCVFCQKKQKAKLNMSKETDDKKEKQETRCLCRLLSTKSDLHNGGDGLTHYRSARPSKSESLSKNKLSKHNSKQHLNNASTDRLQPQDSRAQHHRPRRTLRASLKNRVVHVNHVDGFNKKTSFRFKGARTNKDETSTFEFPPLCNDVPTENEKLKTSNAPTTTCDTAECNATDPVTNTPITNDTPLIQLSVKCSSEALEDLPCDRKQLDNLKDINAVDETELKL